MQYTTTKCPHCGYRTRNRETGVSRVELGQTLACCPKCDKPIIDPIYTEYEFMSKRERKKWSTRHLVTVDAIRGIILLIMGGFFFVLGITSGDTYGIVVALLMGGVPILTGISRFFSIKKALSSNVVEQIIYESLLRTSNNNYVKLLEQSYGKKRTYKPIQNRSEVIIYYKKYSTEDIHKRFEEEFSKLLNIIEDEDNIGDTKKAKFSSSFVNGGALVAGVMAIPSTIIGVKQSKEIADKKNNNDKLPEEKASKTVD